MAKQIGTESQSINDKIMDLEISIAFIEVELEQARTEYQFHRIASEEQLAILQALGLDGFPRGGFRGGLGRRGFFLRGDAAC